VQVSFSVKHTHTDFQSTDKNTYFFVWERITTNPRVLLPTQTRMYLDPCMHTTKKRQYIHSTDISKRMERRNYDRKKWLSHGKWPFILFYLYPESIGTTEHVKNIKRCSLFSFIITLLPGLFRWCFIIIRECNQKFPDWPPGAITANGTALCH
jgi:hypothetical protein